MEKDQRGSRKKAGTFNSRPLYASGPAQVVKVEVFKSDLNGLPRGYHGSTAVAGATRPRSLFGFSSGKDVPGVASRSADYLSIRLNR